MARTPWLARVALSKAGVMSLASSGARFVSESRLARTATGPPASQPCICM